jgi:hypothetical protein
VLFDTHSLATKGITRLKGPDHEIFVAEFFYRGLYDELGNKNYKKLMIRPHIRDPRMLSMRLRSLRAC